MRHGSATTLIATWMTVAAGFSGPLDPPQAPLSTPGPEPRIAVNTLNTPGDSNAAHVISQSGSYYLEDNVVVLADVVGILITVGDVTLDLNGFRVEHMSPPTPPPMVGTNVLPPSTMTGVRVSPDGPAVENIIVRNGIIHGWGSSGLSTFHASGALIESIIAQGNGGFGIQTGFGTVVKSCIARENSTGITTRGASSILDCFVGDNGSNGITSGSDNVVSRTTADRNGGFGIVLNGGSSALDCTSSDNTLGGYRVFGGCIVSDSTAHFNDGPGIEVFGGSATIVNCNSNFNLGDGICVSGDCRVVGNTSSSNGRGNQTNVSGILVDGSDNHIVDNTVTDSTRGIDVDGTGNLIVRNSVSGATVAYAINAGNAFGPLIVVTGDGDISNTAGSGHPQANFTY